MKSFMWGMLATESLTAALVFLRYWKISRDRLFVYFAAAFALMAVSWISLAAVQEAEARQYVYLPRLCAFLLIIAGILGKNWHARAANGRGRP